MGTAIGTPRKALESPAGLSCTPDACTKLFPLHRSVGLIGPMGPRGPVIYQPHLRPCLPDKYRALQILGFSPSMTASHAVSVRRARVLPAASFRFHLAVDTLAVRLTLPPVWRAEDFHLQVGAPCRAHHVKSPGEPGLQKGTFSLKSQNNQTSWRWP